MTVEVPVKLILPMLVIRPEMGCEVPGHFFVVGYYPLCTCCALLAPLDSDFVVREALRCALTDRCLGVQT